MKTQTNPAAKTARCETTACRKPAAPGAYHCVACINRRADEKARYLAALAAQSNAAPTTVYGPDARTVRHDDEADYEDLGGVLTPDGNIPGRMYRSR